MIYFNIKLNFDCVVNNIVIVKMILINERLKIAETERSIN